ncbi:MAG TPA: CAP domain-containing protein [Candidatus Paceibacterota bacterium]|nr:CAP domain-containing protein [Candidatus Paceibacterota bacterium]
MEEKPKKRIRQVQHPRVARPLMGKRDLRLLEGTALAVFVAIIVGAFLISSIGSFMVRSNQAAAVIAAVLVDLTNQNRIQNNQPELMVSPLLTEAAQEKADDEAANSYFAHVSPSGKDPWYWFKQVGYNFTYAGENLAVNFTDSEDVVNAWMNSPEHRANILNGNYTQIGIAAAQGIYQGQQTIFVVQEFGTPAVTESQEPIETQTIPTVPTQVAMASAHASSAEPAILGETSGKPIVAQVSAPASAPVPVQAPQPVVVHSTPAASKIGAITAYVPPQAPLWALVFSSPETALRYAYYVTGFIVLMALALTTEFEFKMHHMRKFAAAGSLLALMICLFFIANTFVFSVASAPENVIQAVSS